MAGSYMPHKLFTDDGSSLMDAEDTSAAANLRSTFDTGSTRVRERSIGSTPDDNAGDEDMSIDKEDFFEPQSSPVETPSSSGAQSDLTQNKSGRDTGTRGASTPDAPRDSTSHSTSATLDPLPARTLDLSKSVKGMYRILDLISEQGCGGLVDKIIIAQDTLRDFINTICPSAYSSLTKVNFKALDNLIVKPIGIYGSKEEIVRFLLSIGAVDQATAEKLLAAKDDVFDMSSPTLRSGLYIVSSSTVRSTIEDIYVLYWPQETTWDDAAPSSVRRNRITFMRYLMKICDQIIGLISPDHAQTIVWKDEDEDEDATMDADNEESDRLFTFEVSKTNEQEESVTARAGFQLTFPSICIPEASGYPSNEEPFVPRLLYGETTQGFITARYIPPREKSERLTLTLNWLSLKKTIESGAICLNKNLDLDAIDLLIQSGLQDRFPAESESFKNLVEEARKAHEDKTRQMQAEIREEVDSRSEELQELFREAVVDNIVNAFPTLNRECLGCLPSQAEKRQAFVSPAVKLSDLLVRFPKIEQLLNKTIRDAKLNTIKSQDFKTLKARLIIIDVVLTEHEGLPYAQTSEVIQHVLKGNPQRAGSILDGHERQAKPKPNAWLNFSTISIPIPFSREQSPGQKLVQRARNIAGHVGDVEFLSQLKDLSNLHPLLQEQVAEIDNIVQSYFDATIPKLLHKLMHGALHIQTDELSKLAERGASSDKGRAIARVRDDFIHRIEQRSHSESNLHTHFIESLQSTGHGGYGYASYRLTGRRNSFQDPVMEFTVHPLSLTTEDQHAMQMDPTFVPSPNIQPRFSHSFRLPIGQTIEHAQILEKERLLLIVADRHGKVFIYFDTLTGMDGAIKRSKHKILHRDKMGQDFILAYDESKRMLALCASTKLQLHIFVFDESYGSMRALGSAVNLAPWYGNPDISILRICFVCGVEEVLLIDSGAQARIFSLITLQFRPASLQLEDIPNAVHSSPDGSCVVMSYTTGSKVCFTAYHWSTFGSTPGITVDSLDPSISDRWTLTSFNRKSVHLMNLDIVNHQCRSTTLDITRKITEFTFKEKGARNTSRSQSGSTMHNCLIECHADVWTRFPVLPAVRRQTISSSSKRRQRSLTFITDRDHRAFAGHFTDMIQTFERATRKPTGDELKSIIVSAVSFDNFAALLADQTCQGSCFRGGEWLVDFLCLIPIHIAITKENRFIPLKDGVSSAELEKSLLGAEVGRIVDSLSFGWYESIFQSYMASKPVKVVSSMGEQSVGKSFALNHLVDTSFAGSAMRTTEGVWMSVTPTDDALIVALDFEGVHSIERSAQEDTLLVLFNTAISNLVLFRNNFALSRDITGLFQSFQSSSTVLDPSANPSLFQSTLIIIIKDVVDSDKMEITREFSLKFQKIVEEEQDANFISRLHAGKLNIIPWPVIESREFYKLFPTLKRRLDMQRVTHHAAGEFLNTLKTLMAKLKANDWGALSQNMAAHHAQLLSALLLNALATGFTEVEPELEPLKNFDTDIPVDKPDTSAHFSLSGAGSQGPAHERALAILRDSWDQVRSRQLIPDVEWTTNLSSHLDDLAQLRIEHVREWIAVNLSRFQTGHANIEELRRAFESATVDLKAGVQLCKTQCTSCHLLCIQSRLHAGAHDCQTSHECIHVCDFCDEDTGEQRNCTISANHPGKHICVVNEHLCGEPCKLMGKQGCLEECTKVMGHLDEDHLCAASVHECGELCGLTGIALVDGDIYSCSGTCCIPSDEDHEQHLCGARLCPVSCQLCKRLCAHPDHLHGLHPEAIHLCGQEHSCAALCKSSGICEIDTAPQSIDAIFTGRNETFQYTKYSQVAKRLKCIIPISPGELEHPGSHCHSNDDKAFHFCTARCENCGYYCTFPLGHPQQEHETSHGSMSQARWAVDGPDGTSLELQGRRFSSNDEGAPMMCNLVCLAVGRHVHIDYCRAEEETPCDAADVQHIPTRMTPNPDRPKDFVTHNLYWRRTGFKDPYHQADFAKCDAMCPGTEHSETGGAAGHPSYCTLPMFHTPSNLNNPPVGLGYVSNDGHHFSCRNPVVMQQAFHVIFVIDRSGSMGLNDRGPLSNSPVTSRIARRSNDRLGAVYSALYSFWSARHAAINAGQPAAPARRDAYSVILFDDAITNVITNDFSRSSDQLLDLLLPHESRNGTDFTLALRSAQTVMEQHFSTERTPVVIFLSDGESEVVDQTIQDFCRSAVRLGKPLSFHAVSFGQESESTYLRRMADIALEVQNNAPPDPLAPAAAIVQSSYSQALDTVRLAETFLGIAESLRKPRGSLLR